MPARPGSNQAHRAGGPLGELSGMSTRYRIGLALEPAFTSRVYRARQLICGQYASWAAEMNMVYMALTDFFQCADSAIAKLEAGLGSIALRSQQDSPQFPMSHRGVGTSSGAGGHIFLDFNEAGGSSGLDPLHQAVAGLLEETSTVIQHPPAVGQDYEPRLPLMQYAQLPPAVFDDAVDFLRAAVADLQVPPHTQAWRLILLRFHSDTAGDDWSGGAWSTDLRWELLTSHPL